MTVVVLAISGCIGEGVVSPLLGNQQLVQSGVLFTSARQIAISVSTSVFPGFATAAVSGGRVSGGLVGKTKTVAETRRFCQVLRGRLHPVLSLQYLT